MKLIIQKDNGETVLEMPIRPAHLECFAWACYDITDKSTRDEQNMTEEEWSMLFDMEKPLEKAAKTKD